MSGARLKILEAIAVKTSASVLAKRDQWARDGAKAWEEYLAAPDIVAAKTARLRQARLEQEQARLEREEAEKVAAEKAASHRARVLKDALMAKSSSRKSPEKAARRKTKAVATENPAESVE
jgi:hypothetical protein